MLIFSTVTQTSEQSFDFDTSSTRPCTTLECCLDEKARLTETTGSFSSASPYNKCSTPGSTPKPTTAAA